MTGVMIFYTETAKQSWFPDTTKDQFLERYAKGDFANLKLDRPSVRIEYGESAGAKFVSAGVLTLPSGPAPGVAGVARHEPKPGDLLVIAGKQYVIDEDGEPKAMKVPKAVSTRKPKPAAEEPKPEDVAESTSEDPAE